MEERDEFFVDEAERLAEAEERLHKGSPVAEPQDPRMCVFAAGGIWESSGSHFEGSLKFEVEV